MHIRPIRGDPTSLKETLGAHLRKCLFIYLSIILSVFVTISLSHVLYWVTYWNRHGRRSGIEIIDGISFDFRFLDRGYQR
jgi:hypothetical protein